MIFSHNIIKNIILYCDSETITKLSQVNHLIKNTIVEISTKVLSLKIIPDNNDELNFVRQLQQVPNIKKLGFADYETNYKSKMPALSKEHSNVIRPFLSYIKDNYPKKLKHLILGELLTRDEINCTRIRESLEIIESQQKQAVELTIECYKVLVTTQIVSLNILVNNFNDMNAEKLISSALEKAVNLTSLTLFSFHRCHKPVIRLLKCLKLEKLRLNCIGIASSTVEQLKLCDKLTSLSIVECESTNSLEEFLTSKHKLNLKVLNFDNSPIHEENLIPIFENLKNLEVFSFSDFSMYNHQLIALGKKCRNLTELHVKTSNMTDQGLIKFVSLATKLKKLQLFNVTKKIQKGLSDLIAKSNDLEGLEFVFAKDFSNDFFTLIKKCKKFTSLQFKHCYFSEVCLDNLRGFVRECPSLRYLEIDPCKFISNEDSLLLKKEFSHVRFHFTEDIKQK